jgi:hypothetical protein
MRISIGWLLVVAVSLSLCSCSSKERPRQKTYPVTGKVTVDGKAVAHLTVVANAKQVADSKYPTIPQGDTKEDGGFALSTYEPGDGVAPGEYTLTFKWQELQGLIHGGPDKLKGRYGDPAKSKHQVTVDKGPKDLGTIELTTK